MATLNNNYPTLAELAKQMDGKGNIVSDIIEILNDTNPILADIPWYPCNNGTKHLTTIRTGLPEPTFRKLYQGVQPTKGTVTQVEDTCGMLEDWAEVDAKLVDIAPNPGQFRLNESKPHLEGMNRKMATTLFYGNTDANPERFMGLAPRFNALTGADNSSQIVNAGGSDSDNTSVWMVVWSDRTCHGLYPSSTRAGLDRKDLGQKVKQKSDGSLLEVMWDKFTWDCGFSVRDWRYVVRIANIDVSNLRAGSVDCFGLLRKGYWKLKQRQISGGRAAIYANADFCEALDAQATPTLATTGTTTSGNVRYSTDEISGSEIMVYRNMPIRETDALINTETALT